MLESERRVVAVVVMKDDSPVAVVPAECDFADRGLPGVAIHRSLSRWWAMRRSPSEEQSTDHWQTRVNTNAFGIVWLSGFSPLVGMTIQRGRFIHMGDELDTGWRDRMVTDGLDGLEREH